MAAGFNRQVRTRPLFWDSTRPPASRTRRCFIRLGSAMANGRASSPTDASPSPSRARIALLVGSARAPKTWSRCDDKLSIRLTIGVHRGVVNNSYPYGLVNSSPENLERERVQPAKLATSASARACRDGLRNVADPAMQRIRCIELRYPEIFYDAGAEAQGGGVSADCRGDRRGIQQPG